MDPDEFQREVRDILEVLLHSPAEALVAAWNLRAAMALDKIMAMHLLLTSHS